jgi:hypothetical protein
METGENGQLAERIKTVSRLYFYNLKYLIMYGYSHTLFQKKTERFSY